MLTAGNKRPRLHDVNLTLHVSPLDVLIAVAEHTLDSGGRAHETANDVVSQHDSIACDRYLFHATVLVKRQQTVFSRTRQHLNCVCARTENELLANSTYDSTRSRNWQKIKCLKRQEFVIAGYTLSDKGLPFSSLVLGVYEKGKLIYAGRAGTGFSTKARVDLKKMIDKIARPTKPFAEIPRDPGLRRAVWAEPKLVGEVAFAEWTNENIIRHPSFQGLREDKNPKEVIREDPV